MVISSSSIVDEPFYDVSIEMTDEEQYRVVGKKFQYIKSHCLFHLQYMLLLLVTAIEESLTQLDHGYAPEYVSLMKLRNNLLG